MIEIKGDALEIFKQNKDAALIHQVNCKGVMAAGIAKQIRKEYPEHYVDFIKKESKLGSFVITTVEDYKDVIGIFGQDKYGNDGTRYTNYAALVEDIISLIDLADAGIISRNFILPKYIGCGLGGGDWNIVKELLIDTEKLYNIEFIIVEYIK